MRTEPAKSTDANAADRQPKATDLSRRSFLKGTAATAVAGVFGAALAGCAPAGTAAEPSGSAQSDGVSWDREVDVLVVGSGTSVVSAIACASMGAESVLVLEKDKVMFGGTSVLSGGGQALGLHDWYAEEGIVDSKEDQLAYMKAVGEGRLDEEVQKSFVDSSNEYCHWAIDTFGWDRWGLAHSGFGDYYGTYPGANPNVIGRGSWVPKDGEGNSVGAAGQWEAYRTYIDGHDNIELMMGAEARRLITDESGAVVGVAAAVDSEDVNIKAKSVVLGTGGYENSEECRRYYLPFPLQRTVGVATNTGDGHRMSARIGAQLVCMDSVFGVPFVYDKPEWSADDFAVDVANADWYGARTLPHSIMVNRKGRRFCDENAMYDVIVRSFGTYDSGSQEYVNIPAYWICDSQYAEQFLLPGYATLDELPDYIFKADTLGELADLMGIEREGLEAEVAAYNEHARDNEDPEFDRNKENALRTLAFMGASMSLTGESPTSAIGTIEKGPFYCCRYVPGTCSTNGGMRINGNAQVLDVDGDPIGGLYAVGACACTVADYWTGGATIGQGSVMSYVAAKHITGAQG